MRACTRLDWYEDRRGAVDGLLLLQPTSPFRSRASVLRGIELFRANEGRAGYWRFGGSIPSLVVF